MNWLERYLLSKQTASVLAFHAIGFSDLIKDRAAILLLKGLLENPWVLCRYEGLTEIFSVDILIGCQRLITEPAPVSYRFVHRSLVWYKTGLPFINCDTHLKIRLSAVQLLVSWPDRHCIVVRLRPLFVSCEWEFADGLLYMLILLLTDHELFERVLIARFKELGLFSPFTDMLWLGTTCGSWAWHWLDLTSGNGERRSGISPRCQLLRVAPLEICCCRLILVNKGCLWSMEVIVAGYAPS